MPRKADIWGMPTLRGMVGVVGSGFSIIAAAAATLVLVSVLLAYNSWPTVATSGPVPRLVVGASTTPAPAHVPTIVAGHGLAPVRAPAAHAVPRPAHGIRPAPVTSPVYSGPQASSPVAPVHQSPTQASDSTLPATPTPAPAPVTPPLVPDPGTLVNQISSGSGDTGQTLAKTVTDTVHATGQAVGGVLTGVGATLKGGS